MLTPIHRALGITPGELSLDLIQAAIDQSLKEETDLDWKTNLYNVRAPKWADEAAKDIAAMANSGGGLVVFGVAEDGEHNAASRLTPVQWDASWDQRLRQVAYARIGPPVVGLEFSVVGAEDGHVVAMRIPDSPDAPHLARKDDGAFIAPIRNGSHTFFMTDRDLESAFRRRFRLVAERERLLQDLFERAATGPSTEDGVSLFAAALPWEPSTHGQPQDESGIYRLLRDADYGDLLSQGSAITMSWGSGEVRKGLRQWVHRSQVNSHYAFRQAFHDDGAVQAFYRLSNLTDREEAIPYYPVGEPNHCMSTHIEEALISFLGLLRAHAISRKVVGGYQVRVGLQGRGSEPIRVRTTEGMSNLLLPVEYGEPIHQAVPVTALIDPTEPVQAWLASMNDLALDIINQGGVKFLKRMAEPGDGN